MKSFFIGLGIGALLVVLFFIFRNSPTQMTDNSNYLENIENSQTNTPKINQTTNNNTPAPTQNTQTTNNAPVNPPSIVPTTQNTQSNQTTTNQQSNQSTTTPTSTNTTPSTSNVENIETSLVIKNIFQTGGVWKAEVDYVTEMSMSDVLKFQVDRGECNIPNMTTSQMKTYAETLDETNPEIENNLFIGRCTPDFAADSSMFYMSHTVNQNPQIRTFEFASNFQTMNDCPDVSMTPAQYVTRINNAPDYSYGIYNTQGLQIPKATIQNSKIVSFDFVNGCAS